MKLHLAAQYERGEITKETKEEDDEKQKNILKEDRRGGLSRPRAHHHHHHRVASEIFEKKRKNTTKKNEEFSVFVKKGHWSGDEWASTSRRRRCSGITYANQVGIPLLTGPIARGGERSDKRSATWKALLFLCAAHFRAALQ